MQTYTHIARLGSMRHYRSWKRHSKGAGYGYTNPTHAVNCVGGRWQTLCGLVVKDGGSFAGTDGGVLPRKYAESDEEYADLARISCKKCQQSLEQTHA